MTFTGRVRWFLVGAAVVPVALIMAVIYFHTSRQLELSDRRQAAQGISNYEAYINSLKADLTRSVDELAQSPQLRQAVALARSGRGLGDLDPRVHRLDFAEILGPDRKVLASYHRPGLVGQPTQLDISAGIDTTQCFETVEYDIDGRHAALTFVRAVGPDMLLYTGAYINEWTLLQLSFLMDADVTIAFKSDSADIYSRMDPKSLYQSGETYETVLAGSDDAGFFLVARFITGSGKPVLLSLFSVAGVVAVAAALLAIVLGIYITGQAKREIDNLVSATSRIAEGDFTTPVMAYEEGEFSQLADSFSDMMYRLRETQRNLAATERIAAWQSMGRKIAHEIKNPLTPIGISADDLRRSHAEGLPNFDKILIETTSTIRSEVNRLTKLLDEFVAFARMKAPEIQSVSAEQFFTELRALYKADADSGRVVIEDRSGQSTLRFDPEAIKQVLINLIKNGLESSGDARVSVTANAGKDALDITVEDSGPGFSEQKLKNSFEPEVSTKKGGSGLGLVICHRIVHDHGGTMELYNKPDGGAAVRIRLPQH